MNTIETSTKLKDCPFCGGEAVMTFNGANGRVIKCKSCQVKMQQKVLKQTIEWLEIEMVKDWNKRQVKP